MKVPTPQTNNPNNNPNGTIGFYTHHEPNSVLDLRRSPSPVKSKPAAPAAANPLEYLEAEDHEVFQTFDWDSIMRELDVNPSNTTEPYHNLSDFLHTQPPPQLINPNSQHQYALLHSDHFSDFNPGFNPPDLLLNWNTHTGPPPGLDYSIQELLRAAECFDSNDLHLAHAILERLNNNNNSSNNQPRGGLLQYSPFSKPLQRAASFFKEALQKLLSPSTARLSTWSDVVSTVRTYKNFSSLSPIPMFTHFTTNQAILDTIIPPFAPPTTILHVIDFDIGLGCRYASLMRELASSSSSGSKPATCPFLRVTAVVTEDYAIETKLIRDSLVQFAHDLNLGFQIDFLLLRTFEMLSFKSVKFLDGEKTAVILSQDVFRRLGASDTLTSFVSDLRRVGPNVVVCTESEGWAAEGDMNTMSFRKGIVNSLEFCSMVFESLDEGGGGDWGRKVEVWLMKPRIFAAVEGRRGAGGVPGPSWKEAFRGAGFRPVQLSRFADFQAECLLGKAQVRGFDVAKRHAELVLCWHQRPLIATSAWRCN